MQLNPHFPFADRITCTVAEACEASGLGRTKIYEAMADGRLASTKIDNRRLIIVASLIKMLEPERLSDAA
jgi:excisionase family DNA binding protein